MGAKPSAKTIMVREAILEELAEHGSAYTTELEERANVGSVGLLPHLYALEKQKKIVRVATSDRYSGVRWALYNGPDVGVIETSVRDVDLTEILDQSLSQFVTTCEGSRYALMLTFHQLQMFEELVSNIDVDEEVVGQIRVGIEIAEKDHKKHEEAGTCILSEVPDNERTRQWKR